MQLLDPFEFVLFGGTGDLAMRKLIPALYQRFVAGQFDEGSRILAARAPRTAATNTSSARPNSAASIWPEPNSARRAGRSLPPAWTTSRSMPPRAEDFQALKARIADRGRADARLVSFDLAQPLSLPPPPTWRPRASPRRTRAWCWRSRSAPIAPPPRASTRRSARSFSEQQIFRIDHYLGKEPVQNLLALRFGNALFEPLWRRGRIRHVQITVGRAPRRRGARRSSTMRPARCATWCRTTCCSCCASWRWNRRPAPMPTPCAMKSSRCCAPCARSTAQASSSKTVRGQYRAGTIDGTAVPGYLDEPGVPAGSNTETFVAIKAEIDNWRWAGVPFYLRTGKRLQQRLPKSPSPSTTCRCRYFRIGRRTRPTSW